MGWRSGQNNLQELRKKLKKVRLNFRRNYLYPVRTPQVNHKSMDRGNIQIFICNSRNPEIQASCLASIIVHKLERKIPFRRAMESRQKLAWTCKEVIGIRTQVSGRLNGVEIARTDTKGIGNIPL